MALERQLTTKKWTLVH